ncbi:uncharacterized protein LOC111614656 [Centruroides sculpturatus]|uniref:uncharacterized protein LOC111614656 n=1 Tax=Centruroides sculpturatus TaxID=218467 RepID=UPI000C6E729D|nr:uncharacterized protein LOC111614656 [Centruroides sculpturatus]
MDKNRKNHLWSARSDAVKSLKENYEEIKHCLRHFSSNKDEKPLTRSEAADLHKKLDTFEYVLLLTIWEKILERIDASNKTLQQKDESLNIAVLIYDSLIDFIQTVRDDFDNLEKEAEKVKDIAYTNDKKRQKIRKLFHDEIPEHEIRFSGKEHFKVNIFFVVCDSLISNIKKRCEGYKTINNKFKTICHDSNVNDSSIEELKCYEQDLNLAELKNEVLQFKTFISKENMSPVSMWSFIQENNIIATFLNLNIILRIYLTLPISNASGKRSFSVPQNKKFFKIHIRPTKIK